MLSIPTELLSHVLCMEVIVKRVVVYLQMETQQKAIGAVGPIIVKKNLLKQCLALCVELCRKDKTERFP